MFPAALDDLLADNVDVVADVADEGVDLLHSLAHSLHHAHKYTVVASVQRLQPD